MVSISITQLLNNPKIPPIQTKNLQNSMATKSFPNKIPNAFLNSGKGPETLKIKTS